MDCYTCKNLSGERPIFPQSRILVGKYWLVEHAYPVKIIGWLVIVLKRHVKALHQLTKPEFAELAKIKLRLIKLLHQEANSEKEYLVCFAEGAHFQHIHFHVVAIPKDLPKELRGKNIFNLIGVEERESVSKREILKLCSRLKQRL